MFGPHPNLVPKRMQSNGFLTISPLQSDISVPMCVCSMFLYQTARTPTELNWLQHLVTIASLGFLMDISISCLNRDNQTVSGVHLVGCCQHLSAAQLTSTRLKFAASGPAKCVTSKT